MAESVAVIILTSLLLDAVSPRGGIIAVALCTYGDDHQLSAVDQGSSKRQRLCELRQVMDCASPSGAFFLPDSKCRRTKPRAYANKFVAAFAFTNSRGCLRWLYTIVSGSMPNAW